MLPVVTDENFREQIVNGLRRRLRGLDLVTAREAGLLLVIQLYRPAEIENRVVRLPL